MKEQRYLFERWISRAPFERAVARWPNDPERYAWPGHYCDYDVQLAWEAWQEAVRNNAAKEAQKL